MSLGVLLLCPLFARAEMVDEAKESAWVVVFSDKEPIQNFALTKNVTVETNLFAKKFEPIAVVNGSFRRPGWVLFLNSPTKENSGGRKIPVDSLGFFQFRVPLTGETTKFEIVAKGP